jgi:2Fe-2S ferredoxin
VPKVTYQRDGAVDTVLDAAEGLSVMQAAVANGVAGILAVCGGEMSCATCHVYVVDGPIDALPPRSDDEEEMLEFVAAPREENSRLSCQLPVNEETDGLVVRIAPVQE